MNETPYLSVIIPAYNEASAIQGGKLDEVSAWLGNQPWLSELIVVDDGSEDGTIELARSMGAQVIPIAHAGKAAALTAGLLAGKGDILLFTDMDQAVSITEAPKLIEAICDSADIAVGGRGLVRKGAPLRRYILSGGQVVLRNTLLQMKITDTQCGFKAMTRSAAKEILGRMRIYQPDGMRTLSEPSVTSGFDVEFLFVADRLKYRIREIPVFWNYQKTRRVNFVKDMFRGVMDLLKIYMADRRGAYPKSRQGKTTLKYGKKGFLNVLPSISGKMKSPEP